MGKFTILRFTNFSINKKLTHLTILFTSAVALAISRISEQNEV